MKKHLLNLIGIMIVSCSLYGQGTMEWVYLPPGTTIGPCTSESMCGADPVSCYGLEYVPAYSGIMTSYTTGYFISCNAIEELNESCVMTDNSLWRDYCGTQFDTVYMNSSANNGTVQVTAGTPMIIHQFCMSTGSYVGPIDINEDDNGLDLTISITRAAQGLPPITDFADMINTTVYPDKDCITKDTVYVTPGCGDCPVNACLTDDDINPTGGTSTYFNCDDQVGYTEMPDGSGCADYRATENVYDTTTSCLVVCRHGLCDTTIVVVLPNPPTPDEKVIEPTCAACPVTECATGDDLFSGGAGPTYTECAPPPGYSTTLNATTGCVEYTATENVTDTVETCIIACQNGVCDTTFIKIAPKLVAPDTLVVMPSCASCPVEVCATKDDLDPGRGGITYSSCGTAEEYDEVIDPVTGCIEYTANTNVTEPDTTCIIACQDGVCDTTVVIINPTPTGAPDTVTVMPPCASCPVEACATKDDLDNSAGADAITYTSCGAPDGYDEVLDPLTGCVEYTPNTNVTEPDTTCIIACQNGVCDTTIVIVNPNPPAPDTVTITPPCASCPIEACATKDDLNTANGTPTITYSSCGTADEYDEVIDPVTGCIEYTANTNVTEPDTTCIVACQNGVCDTTFIIINPTLVITDTIVVSPACKTCDIIGCATKDDLNPGGTFTYTSCGPPTGFTEVLDPVTGCVSFTPTTVTMDSTESCIIACDNGVCDTTVIIIVIPDNTTTAENDINQTDVNVAVPGNVLTNDTDDEGDEQTVTGLDLDGDGVFETTPVNGVSYAVPNGSIVFTDVATGAYVFTPDTDYTGTVEIPYQVCDDGIISACDDAVLVIDITGPDPENNYPPLAADDYAVTNMGVAKDINILNNDSDPDGTLDDTSVGLDETSVTGATCLSVVAGVCKVVSVPGEGVYSVQPNGIVNFMPAANFVGETTPLGYSVEDNDGLEASAFIHVTIVNNPNNETYASDDANSGLLGDTLTGNILTNDFDPEGDDQDVTLLDLDGDGTPETAPTGFPQNVIQNGTIVGTITINDETGEYVWVPADDFAGTVTIPYTACDDIVGVQQACDNATLVLTNILACWDVDLTVILEGAYDVATGLMRTDLNINHILPGQDKDQSPNFSIILNADYTPFGQPYQVAPWSFTDLTGSQFGDATHPNAPASTTPYPADVVDWILVSAREDGVMPADEVWACSAWVHSDGSVTFPEECGCLAVNSTKTYSLMIEHRNHLAVISHVGATKGATVLEYDFTQQDAFKVNTFSKAAKEVEPGVWALYAGNGDQFSGISSINSADYTLWGTHQNNINYLYGDYNMNVYCNSDDDNVWQFNQNTFSSITVD